MPTSSEMNLPVPKSADEFENICADYLKIQYPDSSIHRYGRPPQPQYGIDIYVDSFQILAQCKNYYKSDATALGSAIKKDYEKAIAKWSDAKKFIAMTTFSRDTTVQDFVARMGAKMDIVFWEEIEALIFENPLLLKKYYPSFSNAFPQKLAAFITSVEAFISFGERDNTAELRKQYETAKETGYYVSQFSKKKDIILQILAIISEIFPDIIDGRMKKSIGHLEEQIQYISENGPQRRAQYFDAESKEYVEVMELEEECDEAYRVQELREMIYAEQRQFNSKISNVKKLLESLKAAL